MRVSSRVPRRFRFTFYPISSAGIQLAQGQKRVVCSRSKEGKGVISSFSKRTAEEEVDTCSSSSYLGSVHFGLSSFHPLRLCFLIWKTEVTVPTLQGDCEGETGRHKAST